MVGAPVKAVAAVVAGPIVETEQVIEPTPEPDEASETVEEPHEGSNGVDTAYAGEAEAEVEGDEGDEGGQEGDEGDEGDEADEDDPQALLDRIEAAYGVSLPERYRRFLLAGEFRAYPRVELAGYIRGPYDMNFVDPLLPDVAELGMNAGIHDMDDVPWRDDYAGFVPLASLSHPDVDEPKVFLVQQVAGEENRVLLFDYEGWRLYPLADSLDQFLANLPSASNDIATAFRPGE